MKQRKRRGHRRRAGHSSDKVMNRHYTHKNHSQMIEQELSDSSSSDADNDFELFMQAMDTNQLMTKYYQGLSSSERALMRNIMRLDNSVK